MFIYNIKLNGKKVYKLLLILLCIIILIILTLSILKVFINAINSRKIMDKNSNNAVLEITPENYTNVLKSVHDDLNSYVGKKISFIGYVYRLYDFNEEQFVLARDMIINSDNQTVVVGFLCENSNIKNYPDGTWINITGKICNGNYHGDIPIIKVDNISEVEKPSTEYVYPPDDLYIPTSNIF